MQCVHKKEFPCERCIKKAAQLSNEDQRRVVADANTKMFEKLMGELGVTFVDVTPKKKT